MEITWNTIDYCNVELKLKWTKYCVLSATCNKNDTGNGNDDNRINITFTIKDTKFYVPVVPVSVRDNQQSKLFSKGLVRWVYWNKYKTKSDNKNTTNEYRYLLEPDFDGVNWLFVFVYSNRDPDSKRFNTRKCCLPKSIIKIYNIIINRKSFYGQAIFSDIKRYEEIIKLSTIRWMLRYWMLSKLWLYKESL